MQVHPPSKVLFVLLAMSSVSGCNSLLSEGTADLAGIGGGALAGALTENAVAASGIGLAVRSLAAAGLDYAERQVHTIEQDAIAWAAGPLEIGGIASWNAGDAPVASSGHGQVSVARSYGFGETMCKEIIFSVEEEDEETAFFVTQICDNGDGWHWALAEPATGRWGSLQ